MGIALLILLLFLFSYGLGSLPFGVWISATRGVEIMSRGSKNIGATNVSREVGAAAGISVFCLDIFKGYVPAFVGGAVMGDGSFSVPWALACGFASVLGHSCSPFLGYRGGKGVATSLGVALAATPAVAALGLATFVIVMALTQWVSLSSIVACVVLPLICAMFRLGNATVVLYVALAAYVVARHHQNVARLLKGSEPRFRFKK